MQNNFDFGREVSNPGASAFRDGRLSDYATATQLLECETIQVLCPACGHNCLYNNIETYAARAGAGHEL